MSRISRDALAELSGEFGDHQGEARQKNSNVGLNEVVLEVEVHRTPLSVSDQLPLRPMVKTQVGEGHASSLDPVASLRYTCIPSYSVARWTSSLRLRSIWLCAYNASATSASGNWES